MQTPPMCYRSRSPLVSLSPPRRLKRKDKEREKKKWPDPAIDFAFTHSTLPDHRGLSASDVRRLGSVYQRVLLATPAQKRHRVAAEELLRLDRARYEEIPARVESRRRRPESDADDNDDEDEAGGGRPGPSPYLTAPELQDLMAWKLARGVWRPGLAGRIAANADATVRATTREAFAMYEDNLSPSSRREEEEEEEKEEDKERGDSARKKKKRKKETALDVLCRLGGVGPATASLLLAVAFPSTAPFFSDEIYYFFSSEPSSRGHMVKIRYNAAEYAFIEECVRRTRQTAESEAGAERDTDGKNLIGADDIERATFVVQKLHNPDVWAAALAEKDPVAAIRHKMDEKDESKDEVVAAELTETVSPMPKDPSQKSKGKEQALKVKKASHAASKGKPKHIDKRKRSEGADLAQRTPLRKSKRLKR